MRASGHQPHASAITSRQHANNTKVVSEAQAILFCRRHQPRRPKIRPGKGGLFSLEIGLSPRFALRCKAQPKANSRATAQWQQERPAPDKQ